MSKFEKQYKQVLSEVLKAKNIVNGRNGKVRQITGVQIRADLREGFPLVTSKKIFPKSIAVELEWLLRGETNVKFLNDQGVHIWDQWADNSGDLGPVYGKQIRAFNGEYDQLKSLLRRLKAEPFSRRHLVSMWNPSETDSMALPPCHYSFQFVRDTKGLDLVVSMRSLDLFIGLPYDIAMYALLLKTVAKELEVVAREVVINAANAHVYEVHAGAAATYKGRDVKALPRVEVPKISAYRWNRVEVYDYEPLPRIKVPVVK